MPSPAATRAQQLLEAQVRHHVDRLTGDQLTDTVSTLAEDLFAAAGKHRLDVLVDAGAIKQIVTRSLTTVPSSAAVSAIIELVTEVLLQGPDGQRDWGDTVDRAQLETLLDEVLALTPLLERALERLTDSPLVGTMATRFMGRVVGEVMQANKAVADKVPGLGALVSFGTSSASRLVGAADKQLDGLLGETAGKGGTFAVRRLNRILVETLQDPTTREAVLQVWDLIAERPVRGLGDHADRDDLAGVTDAAHELVISVLASEQVAELGDAVVAAFFERFGAHTPTELLDELDLTREDLVADLVQMAPPVLEALRDTGDLERIVRAQLEPFYASPEVVALLG